MINIKSLPFTELQYAHIGALLGEEMNLREDILSMVQRGYSKDAITRVLLGKYNYMQNKLMQTNIVY